MYFLAYNRNHFDLSPLHLHFHFEPEKKLLFYVESLAAMLPLNHLYFYHNKHGKMDLYAEEKK